MQDITVDLQPDVIAARDGDAEAFARLVDVTRSTVCSIALAIVRDIPTSEDIAQDAYLAAWRSLARLRNPASFLPWLRELVRNHARAFMRKQRRFRKRHVQVGDDHCALREAVDPAARPAACYLDEERRAILRTTIDELDDDAREIITLYYREEASVAHIGQLLGISETAAKKRLQRARDAIRQSVHERFAEILRHTGPGASFTVAVMAGVTAWPSNASAATVAAAGSSSLLAKLATGVSGFAGIAAGLGGVFTGHRLVMRGARDDRERTALRWHAAQMAAVLVVAMTVMLWGGAAKSPAMILGAFGGWVLAFAWLLFVRLPRITERRRALELAEDPAAEVRHRRQRLASWLGFALGVVLGAIPVILAVYELLAEQG